MVAIEPIPCVKKIIDVVADVVVQFEGSLLVSIAKHSQMHHVNEHLEKRKEKVGNDLPAEHCISLSVISLPVQYCIQ